VYVTTEVIGAAVRVDDGCVRDGINGDVNVEVKCLAERVDRSAVKGVKPPARRCMRNNDTGRRPNTAIKTMTGAGIEAAAAARLSFLIKGGGGHMDVGCSGRGGNGGGGGSHWIISS
jgi:hypothetical protein